jgi:hypothetical protein
VAHVTVRYERHDLAIPTLTSDERARMGVEAARFDAKVAATLAVVSSQAPLAVSLAADWDKVRFPPAPDLVVLKTVAAPSPDGWLRATIDNRMPGVEGLASPANVQSSTIHLEPTLFVDNFRCIAACDADGYNVAHLRSQGVTLDALVRMSSVRDITAAWKCPSPGRPRLSGRPDALPRTSSTSPSRI